ncbi:metallophosphoesterase [Brachybacterium huguangmaarense]|uniref:Metallophosphoesterase n=1 Tax=Brachybacterium huguangmaarense TaxID=1652028 RepID=A0ABY6G3C9_9MICO|nr:metallophosphoesterase [Brachybacterium huguangmaarense]UYG17131.1 metallophosphoesterase [Brachybacterium huguangmaarense]
MRILQLSDTHLFGDPAPRQYDRIDTAAALAGVLDRLADVGPLEAVIHTGDASEDGSVASYRALHDQLDPFARAHGAVLAVAMGNHDVPVAYATVVGPGDHGEPWQDRVLTTPGGLRIVALDSSVPRAGYGHLDAPQLEWLRTVLAEPAAAGTVLAVHHPPLPAATRLMAALDLDDLESLADVLTGTDVRLVVSGHYHHEMSGSIAGIPVHVVPGIADVVDPLGPRDRARALALSGASLVELTGEPGSAPQVSTAVWASAGDELADPARPVYGFGPAEIDAIVAAAGRPGAV